MDAISPEMFGLILEKHLSLLRKMGYSNVPCPSLQSVENGSIKNSIRLMSKEKDSYVLNLSVKYYCLLQDLAELYIGGSEFGIREDLQSGWQSQFIYGENPSLPIKPYAPVIDADSFSKIVNHMILRAMRNGEWETHSILKNARTERERILTSPGSFDQHVLLTSMGRQSIWHVLIHQMMLFVVAHEIGHAMLDHLSKPQPVNFNAFIGQESDADIFAADLIFRGHFKHIYQFKAYDHPALSASEWVTLTLIAISMIMAFYHGLEEAASIQPAAMRYQHLPGKMRWENFKVHCSANSNIKMPSGLFLSASDHTSPEYLLYSFLAIVTGCSFKE